MTLDETMQALAANICGRPESPRTPFVLDGWRYATDGHICVRVPDTGPNHDSIIPAVPKLDWKLCADANTAWPAPDTIDGDIDCPDCDGCPICKGTGIHECPDCGEEHDCGRCAGAGIEPRCSRCGGKGTIDGPAYQRIGKAVIALKYDAIIRGLPNARYADPARPAGKPIAIRFDGGEVLVMPIEPDSLPEGQEKP